MLRALVILSEPLPPPLTRLYLRLNLGRGEGAQLVTSLIRQSLVKPHPVQTGRPGGAIQVAEVTAAGVAVLQGRGLPVPSRVLTKGGFLHNVAAEALRRIGRDQKVDVAFEEVLGPVRFDVRWRDRNGRISYFQIGVSDAQREALALHKAWQLPQVDACELILVAIDRAFESQVVAELRTIKADSRLIAHLQVRLIGEVILEALGIT